MRGALKLEFNKAASRRRIHSLVSKSNYQKMTTLVKYEAARHALAEAKAVDEVKNIHDVSVAMKAYARQAQDKQLVIDASEIQIRAERRLGEMIRTQKETVGLNPGTRTQGGGNGAGGAVMEPPASLPTLADMGISKRLSSRSQAIAAIPPEEFEDTLAEHREQQQAVTASTMEKLARKGEAHVKRKIDFSKIGIGVDRADRAIVWLQEIPDTDPLLQEAMQKVIGYCKQRQKQ